MGGAAAVKGEFMGFKAVIFDMDGVLIDTEKYLTRFWRQAAREAGLSLSEEESYQFRSFPASMQHRGLQRPTARSTITGRSGSGEKN